MSSSSVSRHLVIFTPRALTVDNGIPYKAQDIADTFSQWLASRAQIELGLYSVATKSVGGVDIDSTFENLLQALAIADCAIIVTPGKHICLLDSIYPRLLVHLTVRPRWTKRMLLVSLGEMAKNGKKFDPRVFMHSPVVFNTSPKKWDKENLQWQEIVKFIMYTTQSEATNELITHSPEDEDHPSYAGNGIAVNLTKSEDQEEELPKLEPTNGGGNRWKGTCTLAATALLMTLLYSLSKSRSKP